MTDLQSRRFRDFHRTLLRRGRVNDKHIEEFLSDENMRELKKAFTHSSYDPIHNFEMYELLGDGTVNEFIPYYIRNRFPLIVSVKWLTRIKHNLMSKKQLAIFARKEGLEDHILIGDEIKALKSEVPADIREYKTSKGKNKDYISVLEDVMEAYFGCLVTIIEKSGRSHGVAVQICHNILRTFFDAEDISIKYEEVFDAVTRLKELYESKNRGFRWPNESAYSINKTATGKTSVTVYGWPLGNKSPNINNRVRLAIVEGNDNDEAKQKAAREALRVLDVTYHIQESYADPFQR